MNMTILNPRLLLPLIVTTSLAIWYFHDPMFAYERYMSASGIFHFLLFFAVILVCAFLTEKAGAAADDSDAGRNRFLEEAGDGHSIRREAVALGLIALAAQLFWILRMILKEGLMPLAQMVVVRHDFETFKLSVVNKTAIEGVTSFTQLGMIAAALYAVYVFGLRKRGNLLIWLMILFPGVLRGMFFSERLALMEVVIPVVVIALLFGRLKLTVSKLVLSLGAFVVFFSAAEGLRSYQYYSKNGYTGDSVYAYGFGRFLDYIGSSVNHSIAMVDLSGQKFGFPTLLFTGPLTFVKQLLPASAVDSFLHREVSVQAYLNVKNSPFSAPDYTNMGFFGHVFADSGYLYALTAMVFGCIAGMAFRGFKQYRPGWMALYPIVFIALLESYRIPYLFETRAFYPLLYLLLRFVWLSWLEKAGYRRPMVPQWSSH